MFHWKYVIRVDRLGSVEALFLSSASDDQMARRDLEAGAKSDPRVRVLALYRIECLLDELGDGHNYDCLTVSGGNTGAFEYLATGQAKKHLKEVFFAAENADDALRYARALDLKKMRVYQCEQIVFSCRR